MFRYSYIYILVIVLLLLSHKLTADPELTINPMGQLQITPGVAVSKQLVAQITLNVDTGYRVTLRDIHNGVLKNGAYSLPYLSSYGNLDNIVLSSHPLEIERSTTGVVNGIRDFSVSISAPASIGIAAGRYSDTVILEISSL